MISLILSLAVLAAGYFLYGMLVEKVFGPDGAGGLSPFRGNRISGGDRVRRTGFCCLCLQCKKIQQLNRIPEPYNSQLPLNRGSTSTLRIVCEHH